MTKYTVFRQLHDTTEPFIIPNPWDVGSAKILQASGFKALATTSAGHAYSMGFGDGKMGVQDILAHCHTMVNATDLPVTADLGKGFGDSPDAVADTITQAASIGLAGCSIEDQTGDPDNPIYDFNLATERIAAACEAKDQLSHDFVLTARSDNYACGIRNFDDTLKRLQAFEKVGADVLYPPAFDDLSEIRQCCDGLEKPVNILVEGLNDSFTIKNLTDAGVKRISLGSGMYLAAMGGFMASVNELKNSGTLEFLSNLADYAELEQLFAEP